LYDGPAGTGKTKSVLEKVHLAAMKYPGMRALLVRATRASMTDSVLVEFESTVLEPGSYLRSSSRAHRAGRSSADIGSQRPALLFGNGIGNFCCATDNTCDRCTDHQGKITISRKAYTNRRAENATCAVTQNDTSNCAVHVLPFLKAASRPEISVASGLFGLLRSDTT